MLKKHIASTLAIALMATAGATAHAAAYPEKPVTMIVGFSPGGFTDVVARLVSRHLEQKLGQTFVVENKPGAAGKIAANMVAKAAPDGSTFLMEPSNSNAKAPPLYQDLPYDVTTPLTPVPLVTRRPEK